MKRRLNTRPGRHSWMCQRGQSLGVSFYWHLREVFVNRMDLWNPGLKYAEIRWEVWLCLWGGMGFGVSIYRYRFFFPWALTSMTGKSTGGYRKRFRFMFSWGYWVYLKVNFRVSRSDELRPWGVKCWERRSNEKTAKHSATCIESTEGGAGRNLRIMDNG